MQLNEQQDISSLLGALIISTVSATISIAQRILRGYPTSGLWLFSESLSAILAGYLAWDIYPYVKDSLPLWASQPLVVATAAHFGGRLFQTIEKHFTRVTSIEIAPEVKPKKRKASTTLPEKENKNVQ